MFIPAIETEYRSFIEAIMNDKTDIERIINNHVHVIFNARLNTIEVDYKYTFPATVNQFRPILRAIYRANLY